MDDTSKYFLLNSLSRFPKIYQLLQDGHSFF
ncbi:MAG: hypothetical protein ACI8RY_000354, partial [Urechidicola sp.]